MVMAIIALFVGVIGGGYIMREVYIEKMSEQKLISFMRGYQRGYSDKENE